MKGFQKPAVMAAALCVAFAACETKTSVGYSRQQCSELMRRFGLDGYRTAGIVTGLLRFKVKCEMMSV